MQNGSREKRYFVQTLQVKTCPDLSRTHGYSNGLDFHNFRNGAGTHANTQENRYVKLMDKVIRTGVKTKVLMLLSLCIYTPSNYIFPSKMQKYIDLTHNKGDNLIQTGREEGIRRLMRINLLKRLESSVNSFQLTLQRIKALIDNTIEAINRFEKYGNADIDIHWNPVRIIQRFGRIDRIGSRNNYIQLVNFWPDRLCKRAL